MDNPTPPPPPPLPTKPRAEGRGCLFYGCLTALLVALLAAVGGYLVFHYAMKQAKNFLDDYVEAKPMDLPKITVSPAEAAQVQHRVTAFTDALKAGTNTPPLVLNSADLNAWMVSSADAEDFKGRAYFNIESNHVTAQASVPLDSVPMMNLKNKYLNGTAGLTVALTNGHLTVMFDSFLVKGKPLPAQFMAVFQSQNLAEEFQSDPTNSAAISKLDSIEVKDGTLIFKAKPRP